MKFQLPISLTKREQKISILLIFALLFSFVLPRFSNQVHAATLSEASVQLYRMGAAVTASTTSPILVVFKIPTAAAATEDEIRLTIPDTTSSAFTVDSTPANITISTSGLPSTYHGESLTAAPSIGSAANAVSDGGANTTVDITMGNVTSNTTLYGFFITGGITNPATGDAGTFSWTVATLASNSVVDSQSVAVDTTTTNADQVTVTATVAPTFNFALSGTSIALGTLSSSTQTNGNVTVDIDTNANNGWIAWIRSEGGAATLASASTGDAINSTNTDACVDPSRGSEAYLVDVNSSNGSPVNGSLTVATEYNCTDTAGDRQGGVISTSYEQIADRTGYANSDTLTLTAIVDITTTNEAATDYTDTWEVVGAGDF